MNSADAPILELRDVSCRAEEAQLQAVQLAFAPSSFSAIRGAPGSGHALLLRVLGLLVAPQTGEVRLAGNAVQSLSSEARAALRDQRLGFVFHAPFLLPTMTVVENVAMPLFRHSESQPAEAHRRTSLVLEFVGLSEVGQKLSSELSSFDQYRASLARALVNEPLALLVEDLDTTLAGSELVEFTALLRQAAARLGVAVLSTTSPTFTPLLGDRVIDMEAGSSLRDSALTAPALP